MLTEDEFREKFAHYFLDLQESMKAEGGYVNKFTEWEGMVEHSIEEGLVSEEARSWKCPRSLKRWQ
jgi:hypothetical protein